MDDEREYRFAVDDVGEDETPNSIDEEIEALRSADPEPGSPSIEGAVFVTLGALVTAVLLLMLAGFI
ncbi:DUF7312 domain-containing protein [Halocatena salina]|uniref:DUF7312 domain-containing protein n=1 Tax=Halocatena salina TaxID=2934340 RepID=A0A8U0A022_9EURY|nr:hypothetical protein [Halocatena salina]UPM42394.1 hypothetical protein MW046_10555 [Halocatena salina]